MRHTCSAIDTVYHFDWLVWPTLHYNVQHSAAQHQNPFSPTWDFYNSFYAGKFYIIHWFYIRVSKFQLRILFLFLVRFEPKDNFIICYYFQLRMEMWKIVFSRPIFKMNCFVHHGGWDFFSKNFPCGAIFILYFTKLSTAAPLI